MTNPHELDEAALREAQTAFNKYDYLHSDAALEQAIRAYLAAAQREPAVSEERLTALRELRDELVTLSRKMQAADGMLVESHGWFNTAALTTSKAAIHIDQLTAAEPTLPEEASEAARSVSALLDMIAQLVGPGTERSAVDHVFKRLQDKYGPRHLIVTAAVDRAERRAEEELG